MPKIRPRSWGTGFWHKGAGGEGELSLHCEPQSRRVIAKAWVLLHWTYARRSSNGRQSIWVPRAARRPPESAEDRQKATYCTLVLLSFLSFLGFLNCLGFLGFLVFLLFLVFLVFLVLSSKF